MVVPGMAAVMIWIQEGYKLKRTIAMLLVLVLTLGMIPVTAGAVSSGKNILEGPQTYSASYYEYEPNNVRGQADWFNADDAYVSGEVGQVSAGDYYDWYGFALSRDTRLYLMGNSGAGGVNTTRFNLYDASGDLIRTADYWGEINVDPEDTDGDNSDDKFYMEVDLPAGDYYIRVSDGTYWVDYHFETLLIPMLATPAVTVSNRASDGKIVLKWNADEEVEETGHYVIQRAVGKNGTYSTLTTVSGDVTSYVDTSARAGVTYYYRVIAEATVVYIPSFPSGPVSRTCDLPRPANVKATRSASTGKVTVSWNKVTGADKYTLYIYDASGSLVKSTTTTGTSLVHSSAALGKTYSYRVRAVDSDKSSANSALSATVKGTAICAKPVITLSNVASTGKTRISWEAVNGAKSYQLYRSADGTNWVLASTTTATSVTHSSANAGEVWYYKVKALGAAANTDSAFSSSKYRTCDLPAPTLTVSANSKGKPRISWTSVPGAVKYTLNIYDANGALVKSTTTTGTALTHSSAKKGATYSYRVMAVASNSAANSAFSSAKSMTSK